MNSIKFKFSDRLNEACDIANIPSWGRQSFLAQKLNISQPSVSKWFLNKSLPTIDKIAEISDLLGIEIEWLVTGKGCKEKGAPPSQEQLEIEKIVKSLDSNNQKLVLDFAKMIKQREE